MNAKVWTKHDAVFLETMDVSSDQPFEDFCRQVVKDGGLFSADEVEHDEVGPVFIPLHEIIRIQGVD